MRTANICPTCATFENALCIIYQGDNLNNIQVPDDSSLANALILINSAFPAFETANVPNINSPFYGKLTVNPEESIVFVASGTDEFDNTIWKQILLVDIANGVPEYDDNNAASLAGLPINALYRTGDFLKIVHS